MEHSSLSHVDTRAVVKNIRLEGSMQAVITAEEKFTVEPGLNGLSAHVAEVSTKVVESFGEGDKHVVMMDFGYKNPYWIHWLSKAAEFRSYHSILNSNKSRT